MYAPPVFCSQCGQRLVDRALGAQLKAVPVCPACGAVHWQDPKIAAGCVILREDRVLLARRGIEPGYGKWVYPGGHVDRGETLEEAALRETREECGVAAEIIGLLGVYSYSGRPIINAVFLARMTASSPEPYAADETLEVGWFSAEEIAGIELAFRSTAESIGKLFGRTYDFTARDPRSSTDRRIDGSTDRRIDG